MLRELKEAGMVWSAAVKRAQDRDEWRNLVEALCATRHKGTRPNIGRESDDRNRYRSISRLFGIGMCWLGLECRSDSDEIGADLIGKT